MDDELQDAMLNTFQTALIKASENEGLRKTTIHVVKLAFVQALNDEEFVRDLMSSIVGALVQASKEEELTTAILDVVTRAVSQALADEDFTKEIRGAVKDTLQDGDIYKSVSPEIFALVLEQLYDNCSNSLFILLYVRELEVCLLLHLVELLKCKKAFREEIKTKIN